MNRKLHVVCLQYTAEKQNESLAALTRIIAGAFPDLEYRIVVVDNALDASREEPAGANVTLIGGDNRYREFSGMDRGLAWLQSKAAIGDDDIVLLANDTFLRDVEAGDFYRLDATETRRRLDENKVLGHVDCLITPVELLGLSDDHWIRSNFILCSYRVLDKIMPLSLPLPDNAIFSESPGEFFLPTAPLSPVYQRLLIDVLEGRPSSTLWKWHSARRIDADNVDFFKLKTKAILCEFYLSARARRQGFELADISHKRFPSKELRARIRLWLYVTGAWRLVPTFRRRFSAC